MKKQEEQSVDLKKEEKIKGIAEALRKHCATQNDVNSFIIFLSGGGDFISDFEAHRHDVVFRIESIERIIREHGSREDIDLFKEISNTFVSGALLSGHLREGTELIYEMNEDLQSIL